MHEIDLHGERSLVFLGGAFSHAARKPAVLHGPEDGANRRFSFTGAQLQAHTPTQAELALANRVLRETSVEPVDLLYARVDLVPGPNGQPVLIELELTEPQLYLGTGGAAERFAAVIARRAASGRGPYKSVTLRASVL